MKFSPICVNNLFVKETKNFMPSSKYPCFCPKTFFFSLLRKKKRGGECLFGVIFLKTVYKRVRSAWKSFLSLYYSCFSYVKQIRFFINIYIYFAYMYFPALREKKNIYIRYWPKVGLLCQPLLIQKKKTFSFCLMSTIIHQDE